mmetsp:Transcript_40954/g.107561  ORF Transcript_40954/g.107561 Transcript_40954/m.107561 type:complete len:256 (+) Transcript_40954:31-798(+)
MLRAMRPALRASVVAGHTRGFATSLGNKKVAVVLSGCGVYDGSEVQESVFVLNAISRRGGTYAAFAPDKPQMHAVDHTAGTEHPETRNALQESARIVRGAVKPLGELKEADFDAVVFPGGFGAAKNLSDFATKGPEMTVDPTVAHIISSFHAAHKPIGLCCIAPVLAARVLAPHGVEVTVGSDQESEAYPYAGAAGAIASFGAKHVVKALGEAHVDAGNRVATSTAYMCNTAAVHEVGESVEAMVEEVAKMVAGK